jgi:prepilin-type N-terminal cleavage/methylation domain-containing protein
MGKCMLGRLKTGQGFSLIEIMVVIAIIGALTAIGVPNYIAWNQRHQLKSEVGNLAGNLGRARMMAINQNIRVDVYVCYLQAACPGAAVNPRPAQVTVFFINPNGTIPAAPAGLPGAPVVGLETIIMNPIVTLTNQAGAVVGAPQTVGFTPMGIWSNLADLGNNICVSNTDIPGACPQTRQVLNFQNPNAINHRIVILPTGKVAWCYTGNCVS